MDALSLLIPLAIIGLYCCWTFYQQGRYKAPLCDGKTCLLLSASPYYRLFFAPNWWFGALFYSFLILCFFIQDGRLWPLAFLGSSLSVATSIYLIWALSRKLKVLCRDCYLSHAVNAAIFFLLLFSGKI